MSTKIVTIESRILAAVSALQGKYTSKKTGRTSHGVHSVYSGIFQNVCKATGSKADAITLLDSMIKAGTLYVKPSKGGFSYATTPFPQSAKTSQADTFFKA